MPVHWRFTVFTGLLVWCDLGFFPNSRGNKAAANLRPTYGTCQDQKALTQSMAGWTENLNQVTVSWPNSGLWL